MRIVSLFNMDASPTKLLRNLLIATFTLSLSAFVLSFAILIVFGEGSAKDISSIADFWGLMFGLPISAAGAFVAIVLAQRAVDISNKQKQQGEMALEISELMARTEISSIMSSKLDKTSSIFKELDEKLGTISVTLNKLHNWHYEPKNYLAYFGNEFFSANGGDGGKIHEIVSRCNEDKSSIAKNAVEDFFNAQNTCYFNFANAPVNIQKLNHQRSICDISRFRRIVIDDLIPAMNDFSEHFHCLERDPLAQYTWNHCLTNSSLFDNKLPSNSDVTSIPYIQQMSVLKSSLDSPSCLADYLKFPNKDSPEFVSWLIAVFFATKNNDVCLPENAALIFKVELSDETVVDTSTCIESYGNGYTEEALEWAFNTTDPEYLLSENSLKPKFFVAQGFESYSNIIVQQALSFNISKSILKSYVQSTFNISDVQADICAESSFADIHNFPNLNRLRRSKNCFGAENSVNGILTNTTEDHKQLLKLALSDTNSSITKENDHKEFWSSL